MSRRRLTQRERSYFAVRGAAVVAFLVSATVLPHGIPAALLCMAAGLTAVLACLTVNAGGPGETAGARAQARAFDRIRPPQGDWPPFDPARVVDGEVVRRD